MESERIKSIMLFILTLYLQFGYINADIKVYNWEADAQDDLQRTLSNIPITTPAKNVILFIGDGMGMSTITAARWHKRDKLNSGALPVEVKLAMDKFPYSGMSKTYNTNALTAGSGASATALLCGTKAQFRTIGVNQFVAKGNCSAVAGNEVKSILKHAIDEGKWTGVVTTAHINDATPAAAYASVADRSWQHNIPDSVPEREKCTDIADQLINSQYGKDIRVLLGGGRSYFYPDNVSDPETTAFPHAKGKRLDGRDLIQEWKNIKKNKGLRENEYVYVKNQAELSNVNPDTTEYLLGLVNPDPRTEYFVPSGQSSDDAPRDPSLEEMVVKALQILNRSPKGYFLLVEGGRIDWANHVNKAFTALEETLAMDDAIQRATDMTNNSDTLIVITSDHSHTLNIAGYQDTDSPILGTVPNERTRGSDGKPYTTLGYMTGPGYNTHRMENGVDVVRKNITGVDTLSPEYTQDSAIPMFVSTHSGEDVPVYAQGPMAHLIQGTHEQSYFAHVMMYASCVGQNKDLCLKNTYKEEQECDNPISKASYIGGQIIIILIFIALFSIFWY